MVKVLDCVLDVTVLVFFPMFDSTFYSKKNKNKNKNLL